MFIIDAKNIDHFYDSAHILNDMTLQAKDGEFVAIVGPSGCGKTTLLKILGGLILPTHGEINLNGRSSDIATKKRSFGFVFQNPALLPWRSVLQNIKLPLEIIGNKFLTTEPEKYLKLVGLEDFSRNYPSTLSSGMKQRVAIARALVFNPNILLMDEPFGYLDELNRERLNYELLRIWQETQKTIIFVTHSISEAVFLSSRVLILSERPAKIIGIRNIDLPYPRTNETRQSKEFFQHIACIRKQIKEL